VNCSASLPPLRDIFKQHPTGNVGQMAPALLAQTKSRRRVAPWTHLNDRSHAVRFDHSHSLDARPGSARLLPAQAPRLPSIPDPIASPPSEYVASPPWQPKSAALAIERGTAESELESSRQPADVRSLTAAEFLDQKLRRRPVLRVLVPGIGQHRLDACFIKFLR
jgi:hypothetical protein